MLDDHRDVRHRFVFLVDDEIPDRLAEAAARRRVVRLGDLAAIVDAIRVRTEGVVARPQLLLVEKDLDQRAWMAAFLHQEGFDVTTAAGAIAAIELLQIASPDAILSSWEMLDGTGAELYTWISTYRPDLASRLVFITGGDPVEAQRRVAPIPVLPKGQDSPTLLETLRSARPPWVALGTPAHGVMCVAAAHTAAATTSSTAEPPRSGRHLA